MKTILEYISLSLALILGQVLLVNHIEVTGAINPFIYTYAVLILPSKTNHIASVVIGFTIGTVMDAFCGTWGMHAAATTLMAFVRPYIFTLCASQEDTGKGTIAYHAMPATFAKYSIILTVIHHSVLFTLEAFSFNHYWFVMIKTLVSSIISMLFIALFEHIRTINFKTQQKR